METIPAAEDLPPPIVSRPRQRIAGIDVARALAMIGMIAAHVGPQAPTGIGGWLYTLPYGRAAILFVLVAGVGVALLGARPERRPEARVRLAWTAAILFALGLALGVLDHRVWVVLHHYALLFVIGIAALGLPRRWLLALALAMMIAGPVALIAAYEADPNLPFRLGVSISDPPGLIVRALLLTGPYPLLTWSAPFLFGMWLGRLDLSAGTVRRALIIGGAAVTLGAAGLSLLLEEIFGAATGRLGWDHLIADIPHGQTPLWLIGATGSATLVLGLSLVLADALGRLAWPLRAMGQLALSVYVGHLILLHFTVGWMRTEDVGTAVLHLGAITLGAILFATAWRAVLPRGPVETLIVGPFGRGG